MLEAVRNVPPEEGDPGSRRWFADDELELIVWYSAAGDIAGFQLCYDLHRRERAFTWKKESVATTISTFETSAARRVAPSVIRFALGLPDEQLFDGAPVGNLLAISPDGSKLVYASRSQLYMRHLADLEFVALPETAGRRIHSFRLMESGLRSGLRHEVSW